MTVRIYMSGWERVGHSTNVRVLRKEKEKLIKGLPVTRSSR